MNKLNLKDLSNKKLLDLYRNTVKSKSQTLDKYNANISLLLPRTHPKNRYI